MTYDFTSLMDRRGKDAIAVDARMRSLPARESRMVTRCTELPV